MATKKNREHAVLSASGAARWMACTPSAALEDLIPESTTEFAEEGTFAHDMAATYLTMLYGSDEKKKAAEKHMVEIRKNPLYYEKITEDLMPYLNLVIELRNEAIERCKGLPYVGIEERLDLTQYIPEGFGTADAVIISDGILDVVDLKWGQGVPVYAEKNPQIMIYGLGAYLTSSELYEIDTVRMTICQPRLNNTTTYETSVRELLAWANGPLKERAETASKCAGAFDPGAKQCRFCRCKPICLACAEAQLGLEQYRFTEPALLSLDDIAKILPRLDELTAWAKAVKDYAQGAILSGEKIEGYKVVAGRSNRKYTDDLAVLKRLKENGFEEAIITKPRELLTITQLEKVVGKKKFEELLSDLIEKPQGAPTLVPAADPRPAYDSAITDFE